MIEKLPSNLHLQSFISFISGAEIIITILVKNEGGGRQVEVSEGSHDSVVNVLIVFLSELVRDQPRYRLTTHLSLVVVAADRDEALAKALCMNALVKDQI